jgi:site-specific DNA recombinase
MKTAIIMARVSSEEQAKGYSIGDQVDKLVKYCNNLNIEILKIFKENHSAKDFNRPEWKNILKYIKENKGEVNALYFVSWDRFSRNTEEAYANIRKLRNMGLDVNAIEQLIDFKQPISKILLGLYLTLPEVDNDIRSSKIRSGIHGARKAGRYTSFAPFGYANRRDEFNKPILVPDDNAKHIQFIFNELVSGATQADILKSLKAKGCKCSKSGLSKIIVNPIYTGDIRVPAYEGESEIFVKGVHDPIISQELFHRVQNILKGNYKAKNKASSHHRKDELPLRGQLLCSHCGGKHTGSASRSKTGQMYDYYHCNNCHQERIRADLVEKKFIELLTKIRIDPNVKEYFLRTIKRKLDKIEQERGEQAIIITKKLATVESRISNIQNLLADEKLSVDDYNNMKKNFEKEKSEQLNRLDEIKSTRTLFDKFLKEGINILSSTARFYKQSDVEMKLRLCSTLFPKGIVFIQGEVRTPKINEALMWIISNSKGSGGRKKNIEEHILPCSSMVERRGVEPLISRLRT